MENFPILAKKIDIQAQEAQRVPNKMNPKRPTPRHIIIKMTKVKENLKSSKKKAFSYLQVSSHKTDSRFLNRNCAGQKRLAQNIQSGEEQRPTTKITQQGYHLESKDK